MEWFPIFLNSKVVQPYLLNSHGQGRGPICQEVVVNLGPRKLWIRPLVSILGRQIAEAEVIWWKQTFKLVLRDQAPVEVVRKHRSLVKETVWLVELKFFGVLKVVDIEVIIEGLVFFFVGLTGAPEDTNGPFSILRLDISMHDVVL